MAGTPLSTVFVRIAGLASTADFKAVTARAARDLTAKATITADTKPGEFDLRKFQAKLAELTKKVYDAQVGADTKEATARLAALSVKLSDIGKRVENPRISVEGALRARAQLLAVDASLDKLGAKSVSAGESVSRLAIGPMPVMFAAATALAPVVLSVGAGLAGIAAAAVKTLGPVIKAAGTGKKAAEAFATLDPAEKAATRSLLGLKQAYGLFAKALEPQVLALFNTGLTIARSLLRDLLPVSKAVGGAFNTWLSSFGATLQDPAWTKFWAFMAKTAPKDVRLLGDMLTGLAESLPPLLEGLQPVGEAILTIGGDATRALGPVAKLLDAIENGPLGSRGEFRAARSLDAWATHLTNMIPGAKHVNDALTWVQRTLTGTGGAARAGVPLVSDFAKSTLNMGSAAWRAGRRMVDENTALTTLTTSYRGALTPLMDYIAAQLAQSASLKSLSQALKLSHDRIGLKTAAERASFGVAQTYIKNTLDAAAAAVKSGKGVQGEIGILGRALPRLEAVKGKTAAYRQELQLLKQMLDRLRQEKLIHELVRVTGTGNWAATAGELAGQPGGHFVGRFAKGTAGARPGWAWVGERGPELVRMAGGEQVLPHAASLLTAKLAGYAQGTIPGLRRWTLGERGKTLALFARAFARMASASSGGPAVSGGGGPAAALFRRMYPAWATGARWRAVNYVAMRESGWNPDAVNPTSGAAGIAQRIQGWAPFYQPGNAFQQDKWFHDYLLSRYGGPIGAAAHEARFNWYDGGGFLPKGLSLALNTTGKRERVGGPMDVDTGLDGRLEAVHWQLMTVTRLLQTQNRVTAELPRALGKALGGVASQSAYAGYYGVPW